jgi:hypothetical protein
MPWEIDQAYITIDKLKKSIYYIDPNDKIYIDTALNLSDSIIDWEKSSLPKEYFIEKYKILDNILKEKFIHKPFIFEGEGVYGHLNLQKTIIQSEIDYYVGICPDIDFSEHLLYYLIESSKQISNEYFILTPQIFKSWDSSWDILVNEKFKDIPYGKCIDIDTPEIRHQCLDLDTPNIKFINQFKFAGWLDLYNKNFYEKLIPTLNEWEGYGPWDLYSMNVCNIAKQYGVDVQQYVLENQVIWFNDVGCLRNFEEYGGDGQLKLLYKKFLTLKLGRQEQRMYIDKNMTLYLNQWFEYAKQKQINVIKIIWGVFDII